MILYKLCIKIGETQHNQFTFYINCYNIIKIDERYYYISDNNNNYFKISKKNIGNLYYKNKNTSIHWSIWLTQKKYVHSNYGNDYINKAIKKSRNKINKKKNYLDLMEKNLSNLMNN